MPLDSYTEGYLKGYEDGLTEAWNDVIRLTARGKTSKEIAINAKAVIGTIYRKIDMKKVELSKVERPTPITLPVEQRRPAEQPVFAKPDEGVCYLVKEQRANKSLKIFASVASRTQCGLCISRSEPKVVKNSVRSSNIKYLWLTSSENNRSEPDIIPPDLTIIQSTIRDFIQSKRDGVILLDGINYLITQCDNEFGRVLRLVQSLRDEISKTKFSLLVPVNPEALNPRDLRQLESEMQDL